MDYCLGWHWSDLASVAPLIGESLNELSDATICNWMVNGAWCVSNGEREIATRTGSSAHTCR